jgi:SPP1 gp7 family putative phage head morphogenesis protein
MSTSRLISTVNDFRQRLSQHETTAEQQINAAYAGTLATINAHLSVLYTQVQAKLDAGESIPPSWIYEQGRLQSIQQLILHSINQFGNISLLTTQQLQQIGVQLGTQSAQELLNATVPAGVSWSWGMPSPKAIHAIVGVNQAGSPLADLFNGFGAEAEKNVSETLVNAIALGQNPRKIASQVADALGIERNRALVISRNELLRSYKLANTETYRANSEICKQWRWTAAKSSRTCIACLMMDGTLHDVSEDLESHVQCRCAPIPVTSGWDEVLSGLGIDTSNIPDSRLNIQSGQDWFEDQDESTQRAVLGNAKYAAWKDNQFDLSDITGHSHDQDWGHSIYEKSLKQLTKG